MNDSISKLINNFAENFLIEAKNLYHATSNTQILTKVLPSLLKEKLELGDNYKIYGSVGSGNWSEIPWLAILDKSVSTTTTEGYYIVILFDKNLQNIYVCLSVGWTQFENEYGVKEGKHKIKFLCEHYANLLLENNYLKNFNNGAIDLQASKKLGKGYEVGSILYKKYSIKQLSDNFLIKDFLSLLDLYTNLKSIVGDSVLNLEVDVLKYDETVNFFNKQIAAASFFQDTSEALKNLIEFANKTPPETRIRLKKQILRNRKFSNYVKERVNYICELCGRLPFKQKNGKLYAEADHITPLGGNTRGFDSPDNMRCLCAQCHAVITYGSVEDVKKLFEKL